jgi:hypothetical protein
VEARQHPDAASERGPVAEPAVERDRALDRLEGVVEPSDEVGGRSQLFLQVGAIQLVEPVDEVGGAAVVRVRLAIRLERRGPPRGDQRVLAHDVRGARGLGVVHHVGGVGRPRQQRLEHVRVQASPC